MDGYEIRLEILKMAKDLLMEEYHAKKDMAYQTYIQKVDYNTRHQRHQIVEYPMDAKIPEVDQITKLAANLNKFVTNRGA